MKKKSAVAPLSSFVILKKRLEQGKLAGPLAQYTKLDSNSLYIDIAKDLCGKQFSQVKIKEFVDDQRKLTQALGLDIPEWIDIYYLLAVAVEKSNLPKDKKIDYIATLYIDELLQIGIIGKFNKETEEVTDVDQRLREVLSDIVTFNVSYQKLGNSSYNFMNTKINDQSDSPKKIYDAITSEKLCSIFC
jgi:hypothetical protein